MSQNSSRGNRNLRFDFDVLVSLAQGESNQKVMHMLGLMATAGFRMIPSFSRILNNLQSIHYGWSSVDMLKAEFTNGSSAKETNIIQVEEPLAGKSCF